MTAKIEIDQNILKTLYTKHGTATGVAKELNLPISLVWKRLVEYKIFTNFSKKYYCNENFFDGLNEKSLYWLGYLATDGCVRGNTMLLHLATADRERLEVLKDHIEYTGPIFDRIQKPKPGSKKLAYYSSTLKITSQHIREVLAKYNIIPRKTFTYSFPKQLREHPDVRHFIRGCIDGDGTAGVNIDDIERVRSVSIGFCGNKTFVKQVFEFLKDKCNLDKDTATYFEYPTYAVFSFHRYDDIIKLKNYLYKDATVYLQRKYDIIQQVDNIDYYFNHYKHDDNLFSREKECEKQFYLAGYALAKFPVRNIENPHIIISDTNKDEIEFIKDLLGTNNIINSTMEQGKPRYRFALFSKQIIDDLKNNFGIIDNKEEYKFPEYILQHKYLNHFIRGCLDGKGTIFTDQKLLSIIFSGNKEYLKQINEILGKFANVSSNVNKKTKNGYYIKYSGKSSNPVIHYLYQDATIYFSHKYDKIKHLLQ
jgi:LAGLIDADG DNA endonuclease family protein